MMDLTADEREGLRNWLADPWTQRFIEVQRSTIDMNLDAMRMRLTQGDFNGASFLNGAISGITDSVDWGGKFLEVKPRRPEDE